MQWLGGYLLGKRYSAAVARQVKVFNHYFTFWPNEKLILNHSVVFERVRTNKRLTSATKMTLHYLQQDLAEAFMENHAVFHKSFISVYNKLKLNQKRKHAESSNVRDASENSLESDLVEVQFTKFHSKLFLLWRTRLWRKAS